MEDSDRVEFEGLPPMSAMERVKLNNAVKYNAFMSCTLLTPEGDYTTKDGVVISNLRITRDYVNNYADYKEIKLQIPLGTFKYKIYPHLENMEVMITYYNKNMLNPIKNERPDYQRYKIVYLLDKNDNIPVKVEGSLEDLNNMQPAVVTLQLVDRFVSLYRIRTTSGCFDKRITGGNSNMTVGSLIRSIMLEEANKILIENKKGINEFYMYPPDNVTNVTTLTIPSGFRVINLPGLIQNERDGVYVGDIGYYIQEDSSVDEGYLRNLNLYIYPLYTAPQPDEGKVPVFESEYNALVRLFQVPASAINGVTPYAITKSTGKCLHCLKITGLDDLKGSGTLNEGGGIRSAQAGSYMYKPLKVGDDGPEYSKANMNTEFVTDVRSDGINYAPNAGVVGNNYKLASELAKRQGTTVDVNMPNIPDYLILPGCLINLTLDDSTYSAENRINGRAIASVTNYEQAVSNYAASDKNAKYDTLKVSTITRVFIPFRSPSLNEVTSS